MDNYTTSILMQKNSETMNFWSNSEAVGGFCGVFILINFHLSPLPTNRRCPAITDQESMMMHMLSLAKWWGSHDPSEPMRVEEADSWPTEGCVI